MTTEITTHNLAFAVFLVGALMLSFFMLISGFLLGGRAQGYSKNIPFESGIQSLGSARLRFSAKFYLIAMFFVIFDVDALYLYAWATVVREAGWLGFIDATIFSLILLISLFYLVRTGALDWVPQHSQALISHTTNPVSKQE